MSLREETINLSKLYGVKPTRDRGQNFLVEEKVYDDIIAAAKLKKGETVLEVGPGLGFLTSRLAQCVDKVIAVELDHKLFEALTNRLELEGIKNVSVFNEDVMNVTEEWARAARKIDQAKLPVVANLPYTITSIFLRRFVGGNQQGISPSRFVLMLQKEVAERITAPAGKLSVLALSVRLFAEAAIVRIVPRRAFWPAPAVDSAILSLERNDQWLKRLTEISKKPEDLLRLIKIGFSARRKMLKANLAAGFRLPAEEVERRFVAAEIDLKVRAQELGLEEWLKLLSVWP